MCVYIYIYIYIYIYNFDIEPVVNYTVHIYLSVCLYIYLSIYKGLTCTFRESCYSARLSWALVLTWVSPFVQRKEGNVLFNDALDTFYLPFRPRQNQFKYLTLTPNSRFFCLCRSVVKVIHSSPLTDV